MQGNSIPSQQRYLRRKKGPVDPMNQKGTRVGRINLFFFIHLDYQPRLDRHSILTRTMYSNLNHVKIQSRRPSRPVKCQQQQPTLPASSLNGVPSLRKFSERAPHALPFTALIEVLTFAETRRQVAPLALPIEILAATERIFQLRGSRSFRRPFDHVSGHVATVTGPSADPKVRIEKERESGWVRDTPTFRSDRGTFSSKELLRKE